MQKWLGSCRNSLIKEAGPAGSSLSPSPFLLPDCNDNMMLYVVLSWHCILVIMSQHAGNSFVISFVSFHQGFTQNFVITHNCTTSKISNPKLPFSDTISCSTRLVHEVTPLKQSLTSSDHQSIELSILSLAFQSLFYVRPFFPREDSMEPKEDHSCANILTPLTPSPFSGFIWQDLSLASPSNWTFWKRMTHGFTQMDVFHFNFVINDHRGGFLLGILGSSFSHFWNNWRLSHTSSMACVLFSLKKKKDSKSSEANSFIFYHQVLISMVATGYLLPSKCLCLHLRSLPVHWLLLHPHISPSKATLTSPWAHSRLYLSPSLFHQRFLKNYLHIQSLYLHHLFSIHICISLNFFFIVAVCFLELGC